jgi:hypothetical protein
VINGIIDGGWGSIIDLWYVCSGELGIRWWGSSFKDVIFWLRGGDSGEATWLDGRLVLIIYLLYNQSRGE